MTQAGNFDFNLLEEVLKLTLDIPASYAEAPTELKRQYLRFFFKKITADNKEIKKVEHSDLIQELINCKLVIGLSTKLPLVDMFKSRKIEIDLPWNQIEIAYQTLGQHGQASPYAG